MKLKTDMIPQKTKQLVVICTKNWEESHGVFTLWERDVAGEWQVFHSGRCIIGHSGMGWGIGEHSISAQEKNLKKEGDNKTPAGIFPVGTFFGFKREEFSFPYVLLDENHYWVDDPESKHYNQLVHLEGKKDWKSAEKMKDYLVYELGFFVPHNPENEKGKGSCIFFHLESQDKSPTAGCTSLSKEDLLKLCHWLKPENHPRIVQLPEEAYLLLQDAWNLPFAEFWGCEH